MKITGKLVKWLIELSPETYQRFVVEERGKKVLYVEVLRAIYGMLEAAMLWYQEFKRKLEGIGFKFNDYDACVANRVVDGCQHTVRYHVDDLLSSHVNKKVNDNFLTWLQKTFGKYKPVTSKRGKIHEFLGMQLDFSVRNEVHIKQFGHVQDMVDSCPVKIKEDAAAPTPAGKHYLPKEKVIF